MLSGMPRRLLRLRSCSKCEGRGGPRGGREAGGGVGGPRQLCTALHATGVQDKSGVAAASSASNLKITAWRCPSHAPIGTSLPLKCPLCPALPLTCRQLGSVRR